MAGKSKQGNKATPEQQSDDQDTRKAEPYEPDSGQPGEREPNPQAERDPRDDI